MYRKKYSVCETPHSVQVTPAVLVPAHKDCRVWTLEVRYADCTFASAQVLQRVNQGCSLR